MPSSYSYLSYSSIKAGLTFVKLFNLFSCLSNSLLFFFILFPKAELSLSRFTTYDYISSTLVLCISMISRTFLYKN